MAELTSPRPGEVLIASRDDDGALGWITMGRKDFADLGGARPSRYKMPDDAQPWTGAGLLTLLDQAKERLRDKTRA